MLRFYSWAIAALVLVSGFSQVNAQRLSLEPIGSYQTGVFGEGAAEIACYHAASQQVFSVNGKDCAIDIVALSDPVHPRRVAQVSLASFGSLPTSVSSRDNLVAASVLGHTPMDRGHVVFFTPNGKTMGAVEVGWHPDMLTFTPDGKHIVVANEGEPSADGQQDGEGSVSIISVPAQVQEGMPGVRVRNADFHAWDNQPLPAGVRQAEQQKRASEDFEPEGIAITNDSRRAYVTLQENDAVAVVDLPTAHVERIIGLGYKDHDAPGNEIDLQGVGRLDAIQTCPALGMFQPDNVACYRVHNQDYLVLANEGDARDNDTFHEEVFLSEAKLDPKKFPNAAELQAADQLGSLCVSVTGDTDGDGDLDELYTFGGRSISIITTDGQCVYDSGCQIERLVAERLHRHLSDDPASAPKYRTKKGPEPEGLAIGRVDGHTYVFVGLERDNGIVAFDITEPRSAQCVAYVNPGEFPDHPAKISGDVGPEGLYFVHADQSPTHSPLLIVANEVSGSITVYAVHTTAAEPYVARER